MFLTGAVQALGLDLGLAAEAAEPGAKPRLESILEPQLGKNVGHRDISDARVGGQKSGKRCGRVDVTGA